MTCKMMIFDLDGTLLHNDKSISQYTVDIIKQCKRKGILTAVATARMKNSAYTFTDLIQCDYVIVQSGTIITKNKEDIYNKPIKPKSSKTIVNFLKNMNSSMNIELRYEDYKITNNKEIISDICHYSDLNDFDTNNIYDMCFKDSNREKILAYDYQSLGCRIFFDHGNINDFTVLNSEASKFNAILHLCQINHINIDDVIAFGDDYNDLEMIQGCGIGVACGNGAAQVKAKANYVCDSNENDGVAHWIEDNILDNE